MFCTNCGHKYSSADTDFCTRCGTKVTSVGSHSAGFSVLNNHKMRNNRTFIAGILASVAIAAMLIFVVLLFGNSDEEGLLGVAERQDVVSGTMMENNVTSGDTEGDYISSSDLPQNGRWREEYLRILREMYGDIGVRTIISERGTRFVLHSAMNVSLIDLTNDGIPELVFTTAYMNPPYHDSGFASFYVYSYSNGQSSRIAYVEQIGSLGMGDVSFLRYVYSKRDNTIITSTGNDMPWPSVRRTYHIFDDIELPSQVRILEWKADDFFEESGYFIDEIKVTEEQFYAEQNRIFDGIEFRLAGRLAGTGELRAGTSDISMSFEEALSYLGRTESPAEFVQDAPRHDIPAFITIGGEQYNTSITEFSSLMFPLSSSEIYSLRYFVNLETLELSTFDMTDADVANIGELTSLTGLWLSHRDGNRISTFAPIGNLRNLRSLNLSGFNIACIAPLAGLTNLEFLHLGNNQISDLSPLANMTNLTSLALNHNQISDITPLTNLTSLEGLVLELNYISDISPLANMTNLTRLYITGNQIRDITPLSGLHNLDTLWIAHNQIADISPLANLVNLSDRLDLTSNQIFDVTPLARLANVQWLFLDYNQIADITPLASLPSTVFLYLRGNNQITDWSPVSHISNVFGP